MKHCIHCGNKLNETDVFCSNCGQVVRKKDPEAVEENNTNGVNQKDPVIAEKKEAKPDTIEPAKKSSSKIKYIGLLLAAVIVVLVMMFVLPAINNNDSTDDIAAEGDDQVDESDSEEEYLDLDSVDLTGTWTGYVSSQTEDVTLTIDENNQYEWVKTGDRSQSATVYEHGPTLNRGRWFETIFRGSLSSMGAGEYELLLEDYEDYIKINKEELIYLDYQIDPKVISDSQFERSVDDLRREVLSSASSSTEESFLTAMNDFREGTSIKDSRVNRVKHFYYAEMFENAVVNDEELLILTYFSYQNPTEYMETIKTDPDLGNYGTLENFLESFNENLGDLEVIDEDTIELGYDYTAGYEIITLTRQ